MQWLPATDYLSQVDGWIIIIMAYPNAPLISEPDGTPADQPNRVYYPSGINISILSTIAGREHHHKNLHLLRDGQPWNSTQIILTPTNNLHRIYSGESEHQKTWWRGGHSTRVFQRQIAGAHQCRSLKGTNRDLRSRFAYSLKTGRRIYYYLLLFFIYPIMAFNFCCQWCP